MSDDLAKVIATTIEEFNAVTPVTVIEILTALERVRHTLTEAFIGVSE
jgi:1,4-dihydroxy-2-naphthoyl-CoA synthase